jgi:iron(III) transport system substrate-binding protein
VVNSSDAAHFIVWKRQGILLPYVPEDVALHYPAEHRDQDGQFASWRIWLSVIGYNTNMVKSEEAPKSFADLLDPKWVGKIVKAHPGYSGTIMTATYQISRDLGWEYLEKLAKQRVLQVQSSADPPKKLALGERAIMADGNEYNLIQMKEKGEPVEIVYPAEGSPLIVGPSGVMKDAPNPNAAKLLLSWMFSQEGQQLLVDHGGLRSAHALVKEKPDRKPLKEIKTMKDDPVAVEAQADEIKAHYARIFKV